MQKKETFLVLSKEMIYTRCTEDLVIKQYTHTHKSNVNNTFPLKRLIKIIVGQ